MTNNNYITERTEIHAIEDEDGNIKEQQTTISTTRKRPLGEPDYIKVYTDMWCSFRGVPADAQALFLQLAIRMSYADPTDVNGGQIVFVGEPVRSQIMLALGKYSGKTPQELSKCKSSFYNDLKKLIECGAIRRVNRSVYQINPSFAGKGEWRYDPNKKRGGIENIIATFNCKEGTVKTDIVWADDGGDTDVNRQFREGLNVSASDRAMMTETISVNGPGFAPEKDPDDDDRLPFD